MKGWNNADVIAKDSSQETAVNLLGLLLGIVITPIIGDSHLWVWLLFSIFTVLHLYTNYKAVKAISFRSINYQRLRILLENYFDSDTILSPSEVSKRERLFRFAHFLFLFEDPLIDRWVF